MSPSGGVFLSSQDVEAAERSECSTERERPVRGKSLGRPGCPHLAAFGHVGTSQCELFGTPRVFASLVHLIKAT
jgi:hypothetical protein